MLEILSYAILSNNYIKNTFMLFIFIISSNDGHLITKGKIVMFFNYNKLGDLTGFNYDCIN